MIINKKMKIVFFLFLASILAISMMSTDYIVNDGDNIAYAIRKKSAKILKNHLQNGDVITLNHIKLAHQLYYKKINRESYPEFLNILQNPYLITKDVNYLNTTVLKIVISQDNKRKATVYNNGIIKITDLKTNRFIKAYGNLYFINRIDFPNQERIFLRRNWNITLANIEEMKSTHSPFAIKSRFHGEHAQLLYLDFEKSVKLKIFSHSCCNGTVEAAFIFSKQGHYMIYIEYCHHRMYQEIQLYDLKKDAVITNWPVDADIVNYKQNAKLFPIINSINIRQAGFVKEEKFVVFGANFRSTPSYENTKIHKNMSSIVIINIAQKKIIRKIEFNLLIEYMSLNSDTESVVVKFSDRTEKIVSIQ